MMMKLALGLALIATVALANPTLDALGVNAGDLNRGFCLAFQDDQTDVKTQCYKTCNSTGPKFEAFFSSISVTNNGDMTNNL